MTPQHDAARHRFTLATTPESVLDYQLGSDRVVFTHTGVPPAFAGQGPAGRLAHAGLTWAREQGLKVQPDCSYVRAYIQRHPEWQPLLA